MKGISYLKNDISSHKSSNYLVEEIQEKKNQKYNLEKYEKFQPRKKENSISDNESILKGVESQVKRLLSLFLKNIEKEEKENKGDPLFLNAIEKTKKNKHLSISYHNSLTNNGFLRKKSTGNDEEIKKLESLKALRNLNSKPINFLKSNSCNINYETKKHNKDINNSNDISHDSTFNKEHKENNIKKRNFRKFNSNNAVKHILNNIENKNSSQKIRDIQKKSASILNFYLEKKNSSFSEEDNLTKRKVLKNTNIKKSKNFRLNSQKKDEDLEQTIDLNGSIILNKFTVDIKGRSKDSSFSNSVKRKNSSDSQNFLKHLRDIKDANCPTRKNTSNLCKSRPKLSLKKDTSISNISKIVEIYKSDEENKSKNKKNTSTIILSGDGSILNKTPKINKRNIKKSRTDLPRIFRKNVNRKELFRARTIYNSLRKQLKKTIIFRPEDLKLPDLNDNCEKNTARIKKKIGRSSFQRNSPSISHRKLNESNSDKVSNNITIVENPNNEEKKTVNKISLKSVIANNELDNSITDLNIYKQKVLMEKNKNKIYQILPNDEKFRKLSHKGEIYDSLDDDEEDEILEPNNFYINPNSIFSILFDVIILFLSMYSVFHFPLYLAFTLNFCKSLNSFRLFAVIDTLVEIFYIIDFFIKFFKAYYNFDEQLIKKRSLIIKHYIKTWCILDLLEAVPVYTIIKIKNRNCSFINYNIINYGEVLNNLHYLLVYNKIFKFFKFLYTNEELSILTNKLINPYFTEYLTLFMRIFSILSVFHSCTCMFIFIGRNSYKSWLYHTEINNKSFFDIYVCSLYFLLASMTSVGYGDIIINSNKERIFLIFLLMVGIIVYSWTISSFSNYVKKLNEKNITYEKDIEILNDIKLNNLLLPDSLYDRIKRHLKYKQYYEKNDKNIIFDCLPIGLRNILIYEMYKPIIKNFIFFKNFENIDFIVKVVLVFRPIIAVKNDILVNEGDMVEDLMFVKKGVLSVELPINLKNPQKNIHEYLYGDLLTMQHKPNSTKIENSSIFEKIGNFTISNPSQTYFLDKGNMNNTNVKESFVVPGLAIKKRQDMIHELQEKEKERIKNTRYLRILKIRENEHFGDVLMFLEKRSPLRVRVVSKKTELFFLRKMDVVNISLSYSNIWKKINKKSVYNFEQIKKLIRKIIELYCSIKGYHFDESDFEDSSDEFKEMDKKAKTKKFKRKKRNTKNKTKHKRPKSSNCIDINKIIFSRKCNLIDKNSFNKFFSKRSKSVNNFNIPILYNLKNYYQYDPFKSRNTSFITYSHLSNSSINSEKIEKNLLKTYNRHYKYYTDQHKSENDLHPVVSIIKEETENESSIYQRPSTIKNGLLFQNPTPKSIMSKNKKISFFNKNNQIYNPLQIKENKIENMSEDDNIDNKEEEHSNTIINLKNNLNISENSNIKESMFLSKIISSGNDISNNNNSNDFESSNILLCDTKIINNEMKSNECISIPTRQENPLMNLKNKIKYISIKNIKNIVNKNIFTKTKKDKKFREILNSNTSSSIIQNKEINENSESKIEKSIEEIEKPNNTLKKNNTFNILEIANSQINFEIKSSYENINNICNNKYSNNLDLQSKLRTFLLEEANITPIAKIKKNDSMTKLKPKKRKINSVIKSDNHSINRLLTYSQSSCSPKKKGSKFKTNIDLDFTRHTRHNTLSECGKSPKKLASNKKESVDNGGFIGNKRTMNPLTIFNKKKKENLLSMINLNIQTTNQKLNNPNEFYSMYFQSLLKNDKRLENKGKKRRNSLSFCRTSIDKEKIKNNKSIKKIK